MNRTNAARSLVSIKAAADESDSYVAEAAAELRAKRVVNTVATLRVLVPVALITALVISARMPDIRIDNAMAATADTPAMTKAAAPNYFPAQFVNQGAGGEEHVANF